MKNRCPSAKFIKRAYLENYQFVYDGYSLTRNGAVANIIKKEGEIVWGGIYEIDEDCLNKLDEYEGFPNVYKRERLKVKDDEGNEYECEVYLREQRKIGKPSEEYKNIIIKGAKNCNLPDDYIEKFINQK